MSRPTEPLDGGADAPPASLARTALAAAILADLARVLPRLLAATRCLLAPATKSPYKRSDDDVRRRGCALGQVELRVEGAAMDQVVKVEPESRRTPAAPAPVIAASAPRMFYVHPLQAGPLQAAPLDRWPILLDGARDAGFTHVVFAPIFAGPSLFLAADFDVPHAALRWNGDATSALRRIAGLCADRGLAPVLDVALGEVAAEGRLAARHAALFARPEPSDSLDPRTFAGPAQAAQACFDTHPDALAAFWTETLLAWSAAGMRGFRLLLDGVPPACVRAICEAVHARSAARLFGWTPGLPAQAVLALRGAGLDYVFSSLPWWDFHADWFWTEMDTLRSVAPVIAPVEAPFGPRFAAGFADPTLLAPAQSRMVQIACAAGDGILVPMGFDQGAARAANPRADAPVPPARTMRPLPDVVPGVVASRLLSAPDAPCLALLRTDADPRYAKAGTLSVINTDLERQHAPTLGSLLGPLGGTFAAAGLALRSPIPLAPGEGRSLPLTATPPATEARPPLAATAVEAARAGRIGIERVTPAVDDGRFPAKRIAGGTVSVEADIICDGHDKLGVALHWRMAGDDTRHEVRMRLVENDRWAAPLPLDRIGRFSFFIESWRDAFASFRDELQKKHAAGVNVEVELIEGRHLVAEAGARLAEIARRLKGADVNTQVGILLSADVASAMADADTRPRAVRTPREYIVEADRPQAEFAAWYEIFPRSMSDDPDRHGNFDDVIRHLPRIRDMGFDVLYFPPISPIGRTNRKGRNNSLKAGPDDVGSPYAIGSADGGHDAIHPQLGSFDDFRRMRQAAEAHGLEIALDFAIQCSPDHPWLSEHKGWFAWRPDGSMKFAENPPKKYEDIVNVDFYADDAIPGLWIGLAEVVMFWAEQGVRIFRVDNPHTKAFPFWEWMIAEVRARFPDTLFLAEAFTRPKVMNRLGKIGFSQSYTYFTWRNTRSELEEYLTQLTTGQERDFFRPNFFVNTPDINPVPLQTGGRPEHLIRATLAATLSGLWGVYSGFELCEATPLPGREEYIDSEKYQIRAWDWDRPGNITAEITQLNRIRRQNPALHTHLGVTFLPCDNEQIILYEKATADRANVVIVAVSLDPFAPQSAAIELPHHEWGLPDGETLDVADLVTGAAFAWPGKWQRVTLTPSAPYAIWRARPASV